MLVPDGTGTWGRVRLGCRHRPARMPPTDTSFPVTLLPPFPATLHCKAVAVDHTGPLNDRVHCCIQVQENQIQIVYNT
jgi:hypothetical protein